MQVLVFGWMFKNNLGDDLFIEAYKRLFPNIHFTFTDHITSKMLSNIDAVFIGGGSLLDGEPPIDCIDKLKTKPIFYIGVGSETSIHPIHLDLMRSARLIALRSDDKLSLIKSINPNTILIPDLVYALASPVQRSPLPKSVLILPNVSVVPTNKDPHYKFAAFEYFKSEFAQFLDHMLEDNFTISFLSMCKNNHLHDDFAAMEIISRMKYRDRKFLIQSDDPLKTISNHSVVITQRYHGIILSEILHIPFIAIHHHGKLKASYLNAGLFTPYYGFSKQTIWNDIHSLKNKAYNYSPISANPFKELMAKVNSALAVGAT